MYTTRTSPAVAKEAPGMDERIKAASVFALLAAIVLSTAVAVHADTVVIERANPVFLNTQSVMVRPARVTTVRTLTMPLGAVRVIRPSDVVSHTSQIVETRTLSCAALIAPTLGDMSNYSARLDAISQQISMGLKNGWLRQDTAELLQSQYTALVTKADLLMARGIGKDPETDLLEQQINLLNQRVTGSMINPVD